MQCVILAGGLATRMRPITETIPKSLITINDVPFIDYQLALLAQSGVTDVVLSVGYRGEMIRDYVGNGEKWGLKISIVNEGTDLRGTAGAIRLAYDLGVLEDEFFVMYGDSYLPIAFNEVWENFNSGFRPALMTVFKNDGKWDTSNVYFENEQVVLYDKFKRHPEQQKRLNYIDYGLSAFKRSVIEFGVPKDGKHDLAELFYSMSQSGELSGFETDRRFYEIGSAAGLADFQNFVNQNPQVLAGQINASNHKNQARPVSASV